MNNGTCDEDPFYFRIVCSCCGTEIITEADEAEQTNTDNQGGGGNTPGGELEG